MQNNRTVDFPLLTFANENNKRKKNVKRKDTGTELP
jgi:hypothetical protein